MSRVHPADQRLSETIEAAVRRVESQTDAELVVVVSPRSGSYRDVALAVGAVVAWVLLGVLVWSPMRFAPTTLVIELPLAFVATTWAVHRWPGLLAALCSSVRKEQQVQSAAHAAFHEERVHTTRGRTGLLVYWSRLEARVVLLPDLGLAGSVPEAAWKQIEWGGANSGDAFARGLDQLGALLGSSFPATGDNPNERPDAPRLRA